MTSSPIRASERDVWRMAWEAAGAPDGAGRTPPRAAPLVVGLAAVSALAGAVATGWPAGGTIDLLWNPLWALVAWNAVVLAASLASAPLARSSVRVRPLAAGVVALATRAGIRRAGAGGSAAARAWRAYLDVARAAWIARARVALHLAAIALLAGAVAGLYWRGLVFEYRVSWQSTWLEPDQVDRWLAAATWPARVLFGFDLPPAETVRHPLDGHAAGWLHPIAASALIWVGVPRALGAIGAGTRAARLARGLQLPPGHPISRIARREGWPRVGERLLVIPYAASPAPAALEALRRAWAEVAGAAAGFAVVDAVPYGAEDPPPATSGGGAGESDRVVVVFPGAQSPEAEVHGRFVAALAAGGRRPLAVVDVTPLAERSGLDRVAERLAAYRRALADAPLAVVAAGRGVGGAEPLLAALEAATEEGGA